MGMLTTTVFGMENVILEEKNASNLYDCILLIMKHIYTEDPYKIWQHINKETNNYSN